MHLHMPRARRARRVARQRDGRRQPARALDTSERAFACATCEHRFDLDSALMWERLARQTSEQGAVRQYEQALRSGAEIGQLLQKIIEERRTGEGK